MRVLLHDGAPKLLAAAAPFLTADPFSTNVIGVVAGRVAAGQQADDDSYLWATIEDDAAHVVGVAMHTPPHDVFVSRMPPEAAIELAHALANVGRQLSGVNGAVESTEAFARAWTARTGTRSHAVASTRMYRLGELRPPRGVRGQAATAVDAKLVGQWLALFREEAEPHAPVEDWRAVAERRVAAGQVHVWWDGDACVALAAVSAPAAGVARVGPVYTPPPFRRHGYGAAVTAAASAAALRGGARHVVLYTDLANPISNSIYQAIGYRPDHDAEERAFTR